MPLRLLAAGRPTAEQCRSADPPLRTLVGRRVAWGLAAARGARRGSR